MTTTVCATLGSATIPDDGRLELIATRLEARRREVVPHGSQYVEDESLEESEESSPGAPRTAAIRQAKSAERSIAEELF